MCRPSQVCGGRTGSPPGRAGRHREKVGPERWRGRAPDSGYFAAVFWSRRRKRAALLYRMSRFCSGVR